MKFYPVETSAFNIVDFDGFKNTTTINIHAHAYSLNTGIYIYYIYIYYIYMNSIHILVSIYTCECVYTFVKRNKKKYWN